jgi:hypothetical protein
MSQVSLPFHVLATAIIIYHLVLYQLLLFGIEIALNIFTRKYSDVIKSKELLMFKKLLPILFLFTGFQANAGLIGNLTYDGTYISGDGRTYLGLNTIASWDYATTLAATQVGGQYEGFRIANTADADFFIGSLFGTNANACSTSIGIIPNSFCGTITGWADGLFGNNRGTGSDFFWFTANNTASATVSRAHIFELGDVVYRRRFASYASADIHKNNVAFAAPWLLVKDTVAAPEPSIVALMGLGIFGIGFARRRRQS